jgi:hypothetical protein
VSVNRRLGVNVPFHNPFEGQPEPDKFLGGPSDKSVLIDYGVHIAEWVYTRCASYKIIVSKLISYCILNYLIMILNLKLINCLLFNYLIMLYILVL